MVVRVSETWSTIHQTPSRGESDILRLSGEQRLEYIRARQLISEFRLSLDSAVSEVFRGRLQSKRDAGLSDRYLLDLESRAGEFSRAFQCPTGAVTGSQIRAWLQKKDVSYRTRNNSLIAIQTLSSFAVGQKYLPKEWNEMAAVPTWKAVGEEIQIFTPAEMRRLMLAADKRMLPFRAMGGFAGLGTTEI